MLLIKVLYDFIKLSVSEKISLYRFIIKSFTTNPIFNAPDVPIETSTAAVDALETAYLNALHGDRVAISIRNDCEAAADTIYRDNAAFVERVCKGDPTLILSSGFNPSHPASAPQKAALTAKHGPNSGDIHLDAKAIDRAKSYQWKYSKGSLPTTDAGWVTLGISTRASFVVSDLEVGVIYYFIMAGITPEGVTDFCEPVSIIVT